MTYAEFSARFEFDANTDRLGEGGFGQVFKAWDTLRQEFVALKIAPVRLGQEELSLLREFERARNLAHGNIAIYLDCQRLDFPFVGRQDVAWMKYYQAGHLGQLLAQHRLSAAQKEHLLLGMLAGIEYLHTRQPFIIHRDLKPANILIVERGGQFIPLITDFGISRQGTGLGHSFVTNTVKALSLHFAAPEQGDADELRPSADLWSFGVLVAYVWGEGRLPFRDEGLNLHTEAGQRQLRERIHQLDVLPSVWAQVPEPWAAVLRACLVVDPTKRVKSAAQLRQLLAPPPLPAPSAATRLVVDAPTRLVGAQPTISPAPAEQPSPSLPLGQPEAKPLPKTPGLRRHLGLVGATAGVLLLLGSAGYWWQASSDSKLVAAPAGARAATDLGTGTVRPRRAPDTKKVPASARPMVAAPAKALVAKAPVEVAPARRLATVPVATLAAQGHNLFKQQQYKQARPLLQAAAEKGNVQAQVELGELYEYGLGIKDDSKLALYWFRKAVAKGNAQAQHDIGYVYYRGWGVKKDLTQAVSWYRKAANQKNAEAQFSLGMMYQLGEGLKKDNKQSLYWYRKAADQGNVSATYWLGDMYEYGRGIEPSSKQAAYWYAKAAKGKDDYYSSLAKEHLERLSE